MKNITAAVAGATGLVGGRVVAPTRRPLPPHPKLSNPAFDGALRGRVPGILILAP